LLQVWNDFHSGHVEGYVDPKTRILNNMYLYGGFSFYPSVNRMELYNQIEGGYANLTHNFSYGAGAGTSELMILERFRFDYHVKVAEV
jgi:hypothetical protein